MKKKAVDKTFSDALKKLEKESSEDRRKRFQRILVKASDEMEVARVYCNKLHESDAAEAIKASKINAKISNINISGGLIIENTEETVSLDYSYETLLQQIRESLLADIAAKLFANIKGDEE